MPRGRLGRLGLETVRFSSSAMPRCPPPDGKLADMTSTLAAMPILGEPPRPQVLFAGVDEADPWLSALVSLVPSWRIKPESGVDGLRASEWDILVSRGVDVDVPGHIHVLALGCERLGMCKKRGGSASVAYSGSQPSRVLEVSDDLEESLRRLVLKDLVPWLQEQDSRPYLTRAQQFGAIALRPGTSQASAVDHAAADLRGKEPDPPPYVRPFVQDADGNVIAGAFQRDGSGWCWALPFVPERPELWFAAALEDWHQRTPTRVPQPPGWRTRVEWSTRLEVEIRDELSTLRDEREQLMLALDEREGDLLAREAVAVAAAEDGLRRLLTSQGDGLVSAVSEALEVLGFTVINVDESRDATSGQPKVEDLRVSDGTSPEWTNVTEVRGYSGGAKLSDLQRLGRFASLYQQSQGRLPSSRWYIVNQFISRDPSTRQPPLQGADDDVAVFAEDGGLVFDTRVLFRLVKEVQGGVRTATATRDLLKGSAGVLDGFTPRDRPADSASPSGDSSVETG